MLLNVVTAVAFIIAVPLGLWVWLRLGEALAGRLRRRAQTITRTIFWLGPAAALVGVFLVWPLVFTFILSWQVDGQPSLANYEYLLTDPNVHLALRNSALWVLLLTIGCLAFALLVAVLADGKRLGPLARGVLVLPTAISFVAGAIIWRFMFQFQPAGSPQIGTINALWTSVGGDPVAWLSNDRTATIALICVGIWMTTGIATVILAAGLSSLPPELLEAAQLDGANARQVFMNVTLPHLRSSIVVVATLLAITAFKAFDLVYVMTNGNFGTNVIANLMYQQLFVSQNPGRASAIAILLSLLAVPIMIINVRQARIQKELS